MAETTFLPGMACRDPETGAVWRYMGGQTWARFGGSAPGGTFSAQVGSDLSLSRALAAGPDLTDLATAAVYAAQRGWQTYPHDGGWMVHPRPLLQDCHFGATLTEAVQAAAKAERPKPSCKTCREGHAVALLSEPPQYRTRCPHVGGDGYTTEPCEKYAAKAEGER